MRKNDQLSEQILNRNEEEEVNHTLANLSRDIRDQETTKRIQDEEREELREILELERMKQVELDRQLEDEQSHAEELKTIEKETRDRKSELERLRAAASAVEEANRLKREEEEEIAQLKRTLAAEEDRRSKSVRKQKSSRVVEEEDEEEEEWEGNFRVEEATSEEEEERSAKRISKAKRNGSRSPKRRPVALEDSTDEDDDFQHLKTSKTRTARRKLSSASLCEGDLPSRSSKIRMTRRNLSSTSLRARETEDDDTDEEDDDVPPPPRKSPKVKRKPPTSLGNLPRDVNNLMAQFQGFTPMGLANPQWSGSGSPMHMPGIHSNPFIPFSPYGHGAGMPGTAFNSNVGNITNTTIANVGNDNSVNKAYRK